MIGFLFALSGAALFAGQIAVMEFRRYWQAEGQSLAPAFTFPPYRHSDQTLPRLVAHYQGRKPHLRDELRDSLAQS